MNPSLKIAIHRVPVFIRRLPSGDIVVWHPYNEVVRQIVEPICRQSGYWRNSHNNWVITSDESEAVIAKLESASMEANREAF